MNAGRRIAQAAMAGDLATVCAVLAEAPDLIESNTSDGWTPLHLAAQHGHVAIIDLLLRAGADVNVRAANTLASTPLLVAITSVPTEGDVARQLEVVIVLLAHGADAHRSNSAGSTPLHKAAIAGARDVVQLLLACGANVAARNSGGQTPLDHAQYRGHAEIAALLAKAPMACAAAQDIRLSVPLAAEVN